MERTRGLRRCSGDWPAVNWPERPPRRSFPSSAKSPASVPQPSPPVAASAAPEGRLSDHREKYHSAQPERRTRCSFENASQAAATRVTPPNNHQGKRMSHAAIEITPAAIAVITNQKLRRTIRRSCSGTDNGIIIVSPTRTALLSFSISQRCRILVFLG